MCPDRGFAELSQFELDPASIRRIPLAFCRRQGLVVLGRIPPEEDAPVTVAFVDVEESVRLEVADLLERPVSAVRLNRFEVDKALDLAWDEAPLVAVDHEVRSAPPSKDPSPVEVVDDLLARAVARDASDIHFESYRGDVDVRFRIDGILHQVFSVHGAPRTLDSPHGRSGGGGGAVATPRSRRRGHRQRSAGVHEPAPRTEAVPELPDTVTSSSGIDALKAERMPSVSVDLGSLATSPARD